MARSVWILTAVIEFNLSNRLRILISVRCNCYLYCVFSTLKLHDSYLFLFVPLSKNLDSLQDYPSAGVVNAKHMHVP